MHPNKYELMEQRGEQIAQAINSIFKNQKEDILKRPFVGIATLVRRELQRQNGITFKNEQEEIDFSAEYNTDAIAIELGKIIKYDDIKNYPAFKDAIDAYLSN
jgi:hypothetical protein